MNRRTLLQRAAAALASWPLQPFRLEAQSSPFAGANEDTLLAIAEVVLPSALDDAAGTRFVIAQARRLVKVRRRHWDGC